MVWSLMKRVLATIPERNAVRDLVAPEGRNELQPTPIARIPRSSRGAHARTREWRRRALMRKGARLYSTMAWTDAFASLAMLDEEGVVVSWYERADDRDAGRDSMRGHVSRLYTPEDIALGTPMRELIRATTQGESVQTGWRLGIDGRKFWATTTIQPMRLRDGRLQGFSHLIHRLPTPWRVEGEPLFGRWKWPLKILTRTSRASSSSAAATVAAFLVVGTATLALAPTAEAMPPNAKATEYGSGWECAHGYQRVRDACEAINVPAGAYLDASGNRWRCERGYLSANSGCTPIKLPANAYLDESFGSGWRCERRYREAKGACVLIQIPANAHEVDSSYGEGWACDYGYVLKAGACQAVALPANAFRTRSGDEWKCERGFALANGSCVAIKLPANAYVNTQGNDWTCERGFEKTATACKTIAVPANAHLDWNGDRWRCNRGFSAKSETNAATCVEN